MSVQTHNSPFIATKPGRKNVWSFDSVIPDPHKPMHVYAVQILEGHFEQGSREMVKAEKVKTRVVYMKMDENGKLENVFQGDKTEDD